MIFALTVSHSFILKPDKELKFHLYSPFLGSSPLMEEDHWESIPRSGGVRGRNQTYKSCSLCVSGKIPSHHCPDLPVSCCPSGSKVSTSADLEVEENRKGKGKRCGEGPASNACPEHCLQTSLGSGISFEMLYHRSCLAPGPQPFLKQTFNIPIFSPVLQGKIWAFLAALTSTPFLSKTFTSNR